MYFNYTLDNDEPVASQLVGEYGKSVVHGGVIDPYGNPPFTSRASAMPTVDVKSSLVDPSLQRSSSTTAAKLCVDNPDNLIKGKFCVVLLIDVRSLTGHRKLTFLQVLRVV